MIWLLFLAFAAMVFMIPGLNDAYQTPRLVALAAICVPLLLRRSPRSSKLEIESCNLLAAWVIVAGFSRDMSASVFGSYLAPFDGLTAVSIYVAILIGVARLRTSIEDVATAICWSSLPLSAYAIAQRFFTDPLMGTMRLPSGRVIASQGSPVYLGAVLAVVAAVAASLLGGRRARLAAATLALALPALWFTQTRGAMLAAAIGAFALLPWRYQILANLSVLASMLIHPRLHATASDLGRFEIWREALAMFRAHPFVGSGPGTFEMASRAFITPAYIAAQRNAYIVSQSAHNLVLHVMATTGLLGLTAAAAIAFAALRAARALGPDQRRMLLAPTVAFAVVSLFNPVPHSAIALLAMLFGAASSLNPAAICSREGGHFDDCNVVYPKETREYAFACLSIISLFFSARVAVGDYYYAQAVRSNRAGDHIAAANNMGLAARANPEELRIVALQIDSSVALMPTLNLADRRVVASACLDWAAQGVLEHPHDPLAHEIMGRAILVAVSLGMKQTPLEAMAAFKTAQALAPTFPALMLRRRALARALGDAAEESSAARELARVERLAGGA